MKTKDSFIEEAVRQKKGGKAKKLINAYLLEQFTELRVLQACSWYRRLSQFQNGLKLILQLQPFDATTSTETKIMAAEFLSILGANYFARQLIDRVTPKTASELDSVAAIYFSSGEYELSLDYFQKRLEILGEQDSYSARATILTQADCLVRLGRYQDAITLAQTILDKTPENLFNSIIRQAIGEYFVRSGKLIEGLKYLKQSLATFPGKKETYDHALLFRWLGFTLTKMNKKSLGKKYLLKSTHIIKKTGLREEIWLQNIKLESDLNLVTPEVRNRLEFYPGLSKGFFSQKRFKKLELGPNNSKYEIALSCDAYRIAQTKYLGIPIELTLLAFLRVAENWGIGMELLKILIWPEDGHSYLYLEDRLVQIIKRLRKTYKISVIVKNKRVYLSKKDFSKIRVVINACKSLPPEIIRMKKFKKQDLSRIFKLKKSQTTVWLNKFVRNKLLVRHLQGAHTFYLPMSQEMQTANL